MHLDTRLINRLGHGLRTPRESFEIPKLLGLGRQIGPKSFGAFVVFLADNISTHFGTVHCSGLGSLSMFTIN